MIINDSTLKIVEIKNDEAGIKDLKYMYNEIFFTAFPNNDERESIENLIQYIQEDCYEENRHIICLKSNSSIIGSLIFNYFQEANAGYIAYIVIDGNHRRKGYATMLIKEGMKILGQDAIKTNNSSIKCIFGEITKIYKKFQLLHL